MSSDKKIIVRGLAYDRQSSYVRGAAKGPEAALEAFHCDSANLWTETGYDLSEQVELAGLVELPENGAMATMAKLGADAGKRGELPIFLGGDHSVTYPLIKGLQQEIGEFSILHFDAHPDCYEDFEGNKFSHACPFARIMEESLCSRLVSVGIRTATGHQREQKERFGIEWLEMKDQADWPRLSFDTPVYISFDMDALDPAFAPGIAHHEPGGMTTRDALNIIHAIDAPVIGADVVELNPDRDVNGMTAMVTAKLVKEIAGVMLQD